ncbi:hypothetical protein CKAH01_02136 [Colletotrichum kahawae]|uniref:Uncharacterized protein n=1 Tax=Colletotrichum kahawae TaxID=34407 RepID=A0AAD9Y1Y5_COLKA|nr:hypothetical protein CKAH01_02136 [Colletotrichum kahawae]
MSTVRLPYTTCTACQHPPTRWPRLPLSRLCRHLHLPPPSNQPSQGTSQHRAAAPATATAPAPAATLLGNWLLPPAVRATLPDRQRQPGSNTEARHHTVSALASVAHLDDIIPFWNPIHTSHHPFSFLSLLQLQTTPHWITAEHTAAPHPTPDCTTTCAPTASRPEPPNPVQSHPGSPSHTETLSRRSCHIAKVFPDSALGPNRDFSISSKSFVSSVRVVAQKDLLSHGHAFFSHKSPSLQASGIVCIHQPYQEHVVACFEAPGRLSTPQVAPLTLRTET